MSLYSEVMDAILGALAPLETAEQVQRVAEWAGDPDFDSDSDEFRHELENLPAILVSIPEIDIERSTNSTRDETWTLRVAIAVKHTTMAECLRGIASPPAQLGVYDLSELVRQGIENVGFSTASGPTFTPVLSSVEHKGYGSGLLVWQLDFDANLAVEVNNPDAGDLLTEIQTRINQLKPGDPALTMVETFDP